MRFSVAAATTALLGTALAADHIVVVGNNSLTFNPSNVKAAEGDTVTFKFWPKNHSVAQAAFASPCQPMADGFWSGYIPSSNGSATETFMVTVKNASKPLWFYCTQGQHCNEGMVGAINAPDTGNTIDKFMSAAKSASGNIAPNSTAGTGGMLMRGSTSSSNTTMSTGAASTLNTNNGMVFTGLFGMIAYLAM